MKFIGFKSIVVLLIPIALSGCASIPYEELRLDTTSNFRMPAPDRAGIYVYQWKQGILGAAMDVHFEIQEQPTIALNTGEYGYFELPPGDYKYKLSGGWTKTFIPVRFEAGQNYFFRAALINFSDVSFLIRDQLEIDDAKKNITGGRYEWHAID